jgi:hypothetical protein
MYQRITYINNKHLSYDPNEEIMKSNWVNNEVVLSLFDGQKDEMTEYNRIQANDHSIANLRM